MSTGPEQIGASRGLFRVPRFAFVIVHGITLAIAGCAQPNADRPAPATESGHYAAPASPEISLELNEQWKFALNPTGSSTGTPANEQFDDSTWNAINLPHSFDPDPTKHVAGDGWYRRHINVPASMAGKKLYLHFQGVGLSAKVYIDGHQVGSHDGAWEAFDVDGTAALTPGSHLIAVEANNITNRNVVPAGGGDYTKEGGIYREVSLRAVNKTHIALTEPVPEPDTSGSMVSGSGVYFTNSPVSLGIGSATLQIKTVLDNCAAAEAPITISSYLVDADGKVQATQTASSILQPSQKNAAVTLTVPITKPHLWNGMADPYLYDLYIIVSRNHFGDRLDQFHQKVGIRSFALDPNVGFSLNGTPYKLVGVNMHQSSSVPGLNGGQAGWGQSDIQQQRDLDAVIELGATIVRTSHYQRDPAFYSYADHKGLIVETEFGLNGTISSYSAGSAFVNNAQDMLAEMIRQNFNHPSVLFWSTYNEITNNSRNGDFIATLSNYAHSLDSTRPTLSETHEGDGTSGININPDAANYHPYDGWYYGTPATLGATLTGYHSQSNKPMGIGEFGAGGSAFQYALAPDIRTPIASTTSVYHPQNQQTAILEQQWAAIESQKYLFDAMVWVMYDFSSSGRVEGDSRGINDKGLITRDRLTLKDGYHFFQANWNDPTSSRGFNARPILYISDHEYDDRQGPSTVPVTVFSNIGAPTLTNNGGSAVAMTAQVINGLTIPDAYVAEVELVPGNNMIQVSAVFAGKTMTNSVTWNYHVAELSGTPVAKIQFTNSADTVESGFAPDTGEAFGQRPNGARYGWTDMSGVPAGNTSGSYHRTANIGAPFTNLSAQTGIVLNPSNRWVFELADGKYDLHIVGADSATPKIVDNLTVNGRLLHATHFETSGGTDEDFYTSVTVSDHHLSISGGPGMVLSDNGKPISQGRLSSIEINRKAN